MDLIYKNNTYRYTGISYYYISPYGEILSICNPNGVKIIKPFVTNDGYLRIELKISPGVAKKFFIHRLVYSTYVGPLIDGMVIDHINADRQCNHYSNLRQCTQKDNIRNAITNGNFGNNNGKQISVMDKDTGEIYNFNKIKDLIEFTGISIPNGSLTKLKSRTKFKNKYEIIEDIE